MLEGVTKDDDVIILFFDAVSFRWQAIIVYYQLKYLPV